jgi:hypothetical protein
MNISRRGFFGSVLGIVASQNFLVKGFTDSPQRVILPYKLFYREVSTNELIQAPGIKAINKIKGGFEFIAEELQPSQSLHLKSVALFTINNTLITESFFNSSMPMCVGDRFRCSQTLKSNVEFKTVDELIDMYIIHEDKVNGGPH